jgi:hypothetical protein
MRPISNKEHLAAVDLACEKLFDRELSLEDVNFRVALLIMKMYRGVGCVEELAFRNNLWK